MLSTGNKLIFDPHPKVRKEPIIKMNSPKHSKCFGYAVNWVCIKQESVENVPASQGVFVQKRLIEVLQA